MDFEWINVIMSGVCAILGALGGSVLTSIIFYKQTKRTKDAEADKAESEVEDDEVKRWQQLCDKTQTQLEQARSHIMLKNEQVDKLYKTQHSLENELRVMTNKYNSALLFIDHIKNNFCVVHPCANRKPPTPTTLEDLEEELLNRGLVLPVSIAEQNDPTNAE